MSAFKPSNHSSALMPRAGPDAAACGTTPCCVAQRQHECKSQQTPVRDLEICLQSGYQDPLREI
jgi:hypothetical protein